MRTRITLGCGLLVVVLAMAVDALADPCGMVPPIDRTRIIRRVGHQRTYVFYRNGIETFVIKPGYVGNVEQFGMLIPFPEPPAIRKVADDVFEHLAAAIDPPEVVIDLRPPPPGAGGGFGGGGFGGFGGGGAGGLGLMRDEVRVIREEAVGMYEVAVLAAGSADALKKWMNEHQYRFPEGMEEVTEEYVQDGWCFVAVKTRVAGKAALDPQPGQRQVDDNLPEGASFEGYVQAMGFRFRSRKLAVPMRLSAFNEGDLRNVVYILSDKPLKIDGMPEHFVRRQLDGEVVFDNLTSPLPLRVIGGTIDDISRLDRQGLVDRRDPRPHNGIAAELFAMDLLASGKQELALPHEEDDKELYRIDEYFGLRGPEVDDLHREVMDLDRQFRLLRILQPLKRMTLTVIDGDFQRERLAAENLTFYEYEMAAARNNSSLYNARMFGPDTTEREGTVYLGQVRAPQSPSIATRDESHPTWQSSPKAWLLGIVALTVGWVTWRVRRRSSRRRPIRPISAGLLLLAVTLAVPAPAGLVQDAEPRNVGGWIEDLQDPAKVDAAIEEIIKYAKQNDRDRQQAIRSLQHAATSGTASQRGWAIAALSRMGGLDVDGWLLEYHDNAEYQMLYRTWAAAARLQMVETLPALMERAHLVNQFPALAYPLEQRILRHVVEDESRMTAESLIGLTIETPALTNVLTNLITRLGPRQLAEAMVHAKDQEVRRRSAGYLATIGQNNSTAAAEVVRVLSFDAQAESVPWADGPLFLPAVSWQQSDARELIGNLVRWHLWCDLRERAQEQRQIDNNLRSVTLAGIAGFQIPSTADTASLLGTWSKVVGREGIEKILREQDVLKDPRYAAALK